MRKILVVCALLGMLMGIVGGSFAAEPKMKDKAWVKPAVTKTAPTPMTAGMKASAKPKARTTQPAPTEAATAKPMPAKSRPMAMQKSRGQRAAVVSKGRMGAQKSMGKKHHGTMKHHNKHKAVKRHAKHRIHQKAKTRAVKEAKPAY